MAKNPFQTLAGGYYVGDPLPRDPNTENVIQTPTVSADVLGDLMDRTLSQWDLSMFPIFIRKRIEAEIKTAWTASVKTQEGDYELGTLEVYGGGGVPGAFGAGLSVNPRDWARDPIGTANQFIENLKTSLLDWEDVDSRFEEKLMSDIIAGRPVSGIEARAKDAKQERFGRRAARVGGSSTALSSMSFKGRGVLRDATAREAKLVFVPRLDATGNPILDPATGQPIVDRKTGEVDVYDSWGGVLKDFYIRSNNPATRDKFYDKHLEKALDAVNTEVLNKFSELNAASVNVGGTTIGPSGHTFQLKSVAEGTTGAVSADNLAHIKDALRKQGFSGGSVDSYAEEIYRFLLQSKYAESLSGHTKGVGILTNLVDELRERRIGSLNDIDLKTHDFSIRTGELAAGSAPTITYGARLEAALAGVIKDLHNADEEILAMENWYGTRPMPAKLQEIVKGHRAYIASLRDQLGLTAGPVSPAQISSAIAQLEGGLNLGNALGSASKEITNKMRLIGKGGLLGVPITGGDLFTPGFYRRFLKWLVEDQFAGIHKDPGVTTMGDLMAAFTLEANGVGKTHIRIAHADWFDGVIKEWYETFVGGEFLKKIVWTRVKNYLNGYTPWDLISRELDRMHYFGLVMSLPDLGAGGENLTVHEWADRMFKNRLTENRIGVAVGGKKFNVNGGYHFIAVKTLFQFLSKGGTAAQLQFLLDNIDEMADPRFYALDPTGQFLTAAAKDFQAAFFQRMGITNTTALSGVNFNKPDSIGKFVRQVRMFKAFWDDLKARTGLTDAHLADFIRFLGKFNENFGTFFITNTHLGFLQKFIQFLNLKQASVISRLSFVLGPISYFKNILADKLVAAILKILGASAATLTGPIALLFAFFGRALIDIGESALKAVIKMDASVLLKQIDKVGNAIMKWTVGLGLGTIFVFLSIMILITNIFSGGHSPTESTRGGGVPGNQSPAGPHDPGNAPPPQEGNTCPLIDYVVTLPSYGDPESDNWYRAGHGSNKYWNELFGGSCSFAIPALSATIGLGTIGGCPANPSSAAACSPIGGIDTCSADIMTPSQTYYGFALDVARRGADNNVYIPVLQGVDYWVPATFTTEIGGGVNGYNLTLQGIDEEGEPSEYRMNFMHIVDRTRLYPDITQPGVRLTKGEAVGPLYNGPGHGEHLHVELQIGSDYVRPDLYMCR